MNSIHEQAGESGSAVRTTEQILAEKSHMIIQEIPEESMSNIQIDGNSASIIENNEPSTGMMGVN